MTKREKSLLIFIIYLLNFYSSLTIYNALKEKTGDTDDIIRFTVFCLILITGVIFVALDGPQDQK